MKFGIDVNNEYLCGIMLNKIKNSGNITVDLTEEKWMNRGQDVFKKVLLANITNINFYIGIDFRKYNEEYEIFYSNNKISKDYSLNIKCYLSSEMINATCQNGEHLYLIKNMKCPGVYIRVPLKENNEDNITMIEKFVEKIIDLK